LQSQSVAAAGSIFSDDPSWATFVAQVRLPLEGRMHGLRRVIEARDPILTRCQCGGRVLDLPSALPPWEVRHDESAQGAVKPRMSIQATLDELNA
jgi:hypothetical protein